jgi:hypothetical protein
MTEPLKTPEPSKEALLACAWSGDNLGVLRAAYEIDVAPLIAERDALKEERDTLVFRLDDLTWFWEIVDRNGFSDVPSDERGALAQIVAERDLLAAEFDKLTKEQGEWKDQAYLTREALQRAETLLGRSDNTLRNIGMSLGSSDEWTDQATMIADVEGRVAAMKADNERLTKERDDANEMVELVKMTGEDEHRAANEYSDELGAKLTISEASLAVARETIAMLREALESAGRQVADGNTILATATIYDALDVAPLIADLARLTRENAAMREALAFCREHTASCSLHLSRDDDLDHPSLRSTMATHLWQSHVKANAALAQLTPEQQSAALNYAGPENVGAGDALAEARATIAEAVEIMRPFAESTANYVGYLAEEDCDNAGVLTVASLRAAHAFVEKHGAPTNGGEE